MTRQYSLEQKAAALTLLNQNKGNIPLTALQARIPERTLRAWRRESRLPSEFATVLSKPLEVENHPDSAAAVTPLPRQPPEILPHRLPNDDLEALETMRRQILDGLVSTSDDWREVFAFMSPYQRAQVAVMLLDRLMKLDEHLKPYRPKSPVRLQLNDSEGEEPGGEPKPHLTQSAPSSEGDSQQ